MRTVGPSGQDVPVADYLDIQSTLMRYSTAIDTKNWLLFDSVFTAQCSARYGELAYADRASLTESFAAIHRDLDSSMHRVLNFSVVDFDGESARCRSYSDALIYRRSAVGGASLQVVGFYDDDFVRGDPGWLISKRIFSAVHFEGNLEVLPSGVADTAYTDSR